MLKNQILLNNYLSVAIIALIIISPVLFTNIYFSNKYFLQAKNNFSNMRWQEALSNYDKAIKLMPMNADNYAQKGSVYALKATLLFQPKQKIEYHKIAINNFKRAINYNSYQSSYYINLAWLYIEEKDHKMALKTFQKAIEVNPTDSAVYFPYADYCLEHNLLNEALKTYRKFLSLFINDDGPFTRLYGSYEGLFEKIYGYTKEYVNLKSAVPGNKSDVHLAFARFLETKKMTSEALKEYREILAKYPNSWEAKNAIERLEKR